MKAEEEYHKPSKLIACQSWYVPLKGKVIASGYFKASYFYDPQGVLIDHRRIDDLAGRAKISLRTGCFCNPGAGEMAHGLTEEDMAMAFQDSERMTFEQFLSALEDRDGKSAGAVRISMGLASNFADVYKFMDFARSLIDETA